MAPPAGGSLAAAQKGEAGPGQKGGLRNVKSRPLAGAPSLYPLAGAWLKVRTAALQVSKERLLCRSEALQFQDPDSRLKPWPSMLQVW